MALSKEKQLFVNLISSIVVLIADLIINFFLTPYVVKMIGVEANGYVQLANNFVTYATLLVTIINSMAGRFITIEYHRGNTKQASIYYSSVFFADLILCAMFIVPVVLCVYKLEKLLSIPPDLLMDVKLLFFFVFLNFIVGLVLPMWGAATYITNNLYITSLGNMFSRLLRVGIIVGAFVMFVPKVWYIGLASFLAVSFVKIWNLVAKKKLLPELKINKKLFDIHAVKELMSAGIWNAVSNLGVTLINGLDLLICNLFIGSAEMGVLAIAKTLPHTIQTLAGTISNVFAPSLTINYAKGNINELKKDVKQAMNITGIILTIPLAILWVFGDDFFSLWVPSQNSGLLHLLSILTIFGMIFTAGTYVLFNVFVTVNKVKTNSVLLLLTGFLNTLIVLIFVKNTNIGILAVAGVSSVLNILRNMVYTVPYTAKYLGLKWYTFFPQVGKSVLSSIVAILIGSIIDGFLNAETSWIMLAVSCALLALVAFFVNILIVLSKEERALLKRILMKKIKKGEKSE